MHKDYDNDDFEFEGENGGGYEVVRKMSPSECKIINKFKKHLDNLMQIEEDIIPIINKYNRDKKLLEAKYIRAISGLKANKLEEQVKADTTIEKFWDMFFESYEGKQDYLEIDIEGMQVFKFTNGDGVGYRQKPLFQNQPYMEDDWLRRLFEEEEPKDKGDMEE